MSGDISSHRTPKRLSADERRHAAMAATLRLLSTMSYDDLLMEDIAAEAEMSRPLLYHYFGGKEQVTAAAVRWHGRRMVDEISVAATKASGPDWLPAAVGAYLGYVTARSDWYTVLYRHAYLPFAEMVSVRQEIRLRIVNGLLTRLAPSGDSPMLRCLLWGWVGQVETMCQEWLTQGEPSREILEPLLCDLLTAALHAGARRDAVTKKASTLLARK